MVIESGDEFEELADSFNAMAGRIEKQLNSLRTFNEIDRAILSEWETDKIVDTVSTRLGDLIPFETVAISLFDAEDPSSADNYVYERARKAAFPKQKFVICAEELRELREHPDVSVVTEDQRLPSYLESLSSRGMKFFLKAPILLDGRTAALICLGHSSANVWNEDDKQSARQLADQVGVALTNLQLVRKLNQLHWGLSPPSPVPSTPNRHGLWVTPNASPTLRLLWRRKWGCHIMNWKSCVEVDWFTMSAKLEYLRPF